MEDQRAAQLSSSLPSSTKSVSLTFCTISVYLSVCPSVLYLSVLPNECRSGFNRVVEPEWPFWLESEKTGGPGLSSDPERQKIQIRSGKSGSQKNPPKNCKYKQYFIYHSQHSFLVEGKWVCRTKNYVGRFFVSSSVFQLTAINVQLSHFQLNCEKRFKEIVRGLGKIIMISKGHNGI